MSLRKVVELAVSLAAVVATFGCVAHGTARAGAPPALSIDEHADHATLPLVVGQKLVLTLPGNPTTGFQWQAISRGEPVLEPEGVPEYAAEGSAIGAGGRYRYTLKAVRPGSAPVKLVYRRSFEPDLPPARVFEVTVQVAAS